MAFYNKVGTLLRQSISLNSTLHGQVPMINAIRYMSTKLFIGGLSYGTDDQSLRDAFSSFGDVIDAKVITDRDTGRSRGFGFVNYTTEECANSALSAMDGQELMGRNIRVSYANERQPRNDFGDNPRGGFRGGFGDGANDGY